MATSLKFTKLPPLKALKGFESTARLRSFRKAAQELNLTHPAISHQIQSLEKNLGVKLFVRERRQAVLTPDGERLHVSAWFPVLHMTGAWPGRLVIPVTVLALHVLVPVSV